MSPHTIQGNYGDAYETDAARRHPLGQRMLVPNGKVYRYAEMGGTAGVPAKLYSSEAPNAEWDTMAITTAITTLVSTSVSFTNGNSAMAEDELAFGYMCVEETSDLGEYHRIAGNVACGATATGTLYLFPGDVIQTSVAVASGNVITVVKSPFKDIVLTPAAATLSSMPVGVPQVAIAADNFGWVQTHGVCSILVEGTPVIGYPVRPTESATAADAGGVTALDMDEGDDEDLNEVARTIEVASDADYGTFFLTIEGLS